MSITYGFFDSKNHDRVYDALEFGRIFDGIITDGIFKDVGGAFEVTANGQNMVVSVASGRAWFNNTWILNDSVYPIRINTAQASMTRIDAIVLEIDHQRRKNSISVYEGTATASNPQKPTWTNTENLQAYAIAYVTIGLGATYLTQNDIEDNRETESCPYVSGEVALEPAPAIDVTVQYEDAFNSQFNIFKQQKQVEFDTFETQIVNELNSTQIGQLYNAINDKESKPIVNMNAELKANQMEVSFAFIASGGAFNDDSILDFYATGSDSAILVNSVVNATSSTVFVTATFMPVDYDRIIKLVVRTY